MQPARGRAFARASLAGNPSDGYGGKTLAVVIRDFAAEGQVIPAKTDRLVSPGPGGQALMQATLTRFRTGVQEPGPVEIRCVTSVPREVGMAGSSAIIIAVLRALAAATGASLGPDHLARIALAVEVEDLGIVAGMQDRLVQAHEALLEMDFGPGGGTQVLDPGLLPELYVAWSAKAAAASGKVHGELRARWRRGDPELRGAMSELAARATAARDALLARDADGFAACIDASLDLRRRIMPVDPSVIHMAEIVRAHGGSANSAGSGGAIVGTLPEPDRWPALAVALRRAGFAAMRPHRS